MSKSILGIARSTSQVEVTLEDLQSSGYVPPADISVLMRDSEGAPEFGSVRATKPSEGAATGGAIGGRVGLLAGLRTIAIPGVGPFVAAGPIIAALGGAAAGATAGGVVSALVGLGICEYEAKAYQERIKKGGYLVAVHVEDNGKGNVVRNILKQNDLENISLVSKRIIQNSCHWVL